MGENKKKTDIKKTISQCAKLLLIFGALCIITSFVMTTSEGKAQKYKLSPQGGTVGPITSTKDNTVYAVSVEQSIVNDSLWSFVSGELLDENKNFLFGFGEEFWSESGYDDEGYWSEKVTSYEMDMTIPKKGTYYLKFNSEVSAGVNTPIQIIVDRKTGSGLAFVLVGILSLIVGIAVNEIGKKR